MTTTPEGPDPDLPPLTPAPPPTATARSPWFDEETGSIFVPGRGLIEPFNLSDEPDQTPQAPPSTPQPLPPEERSRRGIMVVAAVGWVVVNVVSVVLALTVTPEHYAAVAATLTPMASLLSAFLAAAVTYYFTHKD